MVCKTKHSTLATTRVDNSKCMTADLLEDHFTIYLNAQKKITQVLHSPSIETVIDIQPRTSENLQFF